MDAAILDATLAGVADVGYDRLSMDDIASRAGFLLIDRQGIFPTIPILTRLIRRSPARLAPLHRWLTRLLPVPGWCFLNVLRFQRP